MNHAARAHSSLILGWAQRPAAVFLGGLSLEGFSLIRDALRTTTHAPCQIRKRSRHVDKSV